MGEHGPSGVFAGCMDGAGGADDVGAQLGSRGVKPRSIAGGHVPRLGHQKGRRKVIAHASRETRKLSLKAGRRSAMVARLTRSSGVALLGCRASEKTTQHAGTKIQHWSGSAWPPTGQAIFGSRDGESSRRGRGWNRRHSTTCRVSRLHHATLPKAGESAGECRESSNLKISGLGGTIARQPMRTGFGTDSWPPGL